MAKQQQKKTRSSARYTKEQLATSKRYANRRDLISTLLADGETYTLEEADARIAQFMKGKVN